ncbi:unnamed protein product [Amoebophrya sp. A25]|nr:unnamed protein product [Amoebophrya sp. A25]|eukprot:GSA25T00004534001.1
MSSSPTGAASLPTWKPGQQQMTSQFPISADPFLESSVTFLETFKFFLKDRLDFEPVVKKVWSDQLVSLPTATKRLNATLQDKARVQGYAGEKDLLNEVETYFAKRAATQRASLKSDVSGGLSKSSAPQEVSTIPPTRQTSVLSFVGPHGLSSGKSHKRGNKRSKNASGSGGSGTADDSAGQEPTDGGGSAASAAGGAAGGTANFPLGPRGKPRRAPQKGLEDSETDSDEYDADDVAGFVHPNTRRALNGRKPPALAKGKIPFSDDEDAFRTFLYKVGHENPNLTMKYVLPCFYHLNFDGVASLEGVVRIPSSFSNLQRVSLNRCGLRALAPEVLHAPCLERLSLYNNQITHVRPYDRRAHARNSKLQFLGIGCNFLDGVAVEEILEWFQNLLVLDVSFNFVVELDAWSDTLMSIELTGNPISLCADLPVLLADMFPRNASTEILRDIDKGKLGSTLLGSTTGAVATPEPSLACKALPLQFVVHSIGNLHRCSVDAEVLASVVSQLHIRVEVPSGSVVFLKPECAAAPDLAAQQQAEVDAQEAGEPAPAVEAVAFDEASALFRQKFSPAQLCAWILSVPHFEIGTVSAQYVPPETTPPAEGEEAPTEPTAEELEKHKNAFLEENFVALAGASVDVQRWLWHSRRKLKEVTAPLVLGAANARMAKNRMPHFRKIREAPMSMTLSLFLDYDAQDEAESGEGQS